MLGYFPTPYPNELLYSLVARYAIHAGLRENQKATIREVFSSSTAAAIPDLPSHIDALAHNLKLVWPTDSLSLIRQYTLAPIYLPFLSSEQATRVVNSMRSNSGGNIHTRSGISANSVKQPEFFRYCPDCLVEQIEHNGECYWNRTHQLPGLELCLHHHRSFENSRFYFHAKEKHLFVAASEIKKNYIEAPRTISVQEANLYLRYEELTRSDLIKGLGFNRWTLFYSKLVSELGLKNGTRVNHADIHQIIKNAWRGTSYQPYFQQTSDSSWVTSVFRKHRNSFHPLKHLLVFCALLPGKSVEDILVEVRHLPDELPHEAAAKTITAIARSEIKARRSIWSKLMKENQELGVKELRSLNQGGAVYTWLYRHDWQWLMHNKPSRKSENSRHFSIDYKVWDTQNLEYLETIYNTLISDPNRRRLSRTKLIKLLPRSNSVEKHLIDLPETQKWLIEHEESVEDHQIFRLKNAKDELIREHIEVKRWRLLKAANIRYELITSRIENVIEYLELESPYQL